MTLTKGQKVSFTLYGKPETATIERIANGIVWLDNGRWMHETSVTPISGRSRKARYLELAELAIENDLEIIYDVASNVGQIVSNVRHMTWFRNSVAEELKDQYGTVQEARKAIEQEIAKTDSEREEL